MSTPAVPLPQASWHRAIHHSATTAAAHLRLRAAQQELR